MSDRITPDSFFSDTHAFVAPQPVRFFFLVLRRIRAKMYSIYSFRTHKKTFVSRVLLRESFSTAPSDSAFSHKEEKKEKKMFSLFWVCKQKPRRRFFDISKFIRSADLCILYNTHILFSRSDYYYYYDFKNR